MEYEIIEKIGEGAFGLTYKVKYKGGLYCLKRQRILEKDVKNFKQSWLWKEIEFAKKMEKFPCCFIKLYEYRIINPCETPFTHKITDVLKDTLEPLNKSPYCVELIYDLLDGSLDAILSTFNLKQKYSMIIQVVYAMYLYRSMDYYHGDLTTRNVGFVKTSNEFVNINGTNIPTYGYIYKLIDYGQTKPRNTIPAYQFIDNFDMIRFCRDFNHYIDHLFDLPRNMKINKQIIKTPQYREIKKYIISSDGYEITKLIELYYKLLYTKEYLVMIKIKESDMNKYIEYMIPVADQLFMLENRKMPLKIIQYFVDKLN